MSQQLATVLATTLALLGQFQDTLSPSSLAQSTLPPSKDATALPLLSASSSALKAQVTKLSLLAITTPFTHSAVTTVLRACNESALPSLLTATLLVNPAEYTNAFHSETLVLVRTVLTEFTTLVEVVKGLAEKKTNAKEENPRKKEDQLSKAEKETVTLATGRVWDACDSVAHVASNGVVGFITRRVEQWRDLVRDAVEELDNWDPEEDGDDFFDELLGDEKDDHEEDGSDGEAEDDDQDLAAQREQKKATLRFLKPVAQIYPAIINYRLKKVNDTPLASAEAVARLEKMMVNLQSIPDDVDEAAGALYEEDIGRSVKFLQKVQKSASQAVESATAPWCTSETEDVKLLGQKFAVWSQTWSKVMDEVVKSIDAGTAALKQ